VHAPARPAGEGVIQRAHRKYENPKKGTLGFVKPEKPVRLYRTMGSSGVNRIAKSVAAKKGPGLGNRRNDGEPVGENFYAESLEYAREYQDKGKRKGEGRTLRFTLDPSIRRTLLLNPKYARAHASVQGEMGFQNIPKAGKGERGTVLVKKERIGKSKFRMSTNYGLRETSDPSSPENPYTMFNRSIRSIHILPRTEAPKKGKAAKKGGKGSVSLSMTSSPSEKAKPELLYRRPLPFPLRRRRRAVMANDAQAESSQSTSSVSVSNVNSAMSQMNIKPSEKDEKSDDDSS
jgi:hypothetical protein